MFVIGQHLGGRDVLPPEPVANAPTLLHVVDNQVLRLSGIEFEKRYYRKRRNIRLCLISFLIFLYLLL